MKNKKWNWNNPVTWKQSILMSCVALAIMGVSYGIALLNVRETSKQIKQTSEDLDELLKDVD